LLILPADLISFAERLLLLVVAVRGMLIHSPGRRADEVVEHRHVARGFVDQTTGKVHLSCVLVPVGHSPPPAKALGIIREFIAPMSEEGAALELMLVWKRRSAETR